MTEQDLDDLYTEISHAMAALGEAKAQLFLARLCLLLMHELGDTARAQRAIAQAAADIAQP